MTSKSAFEISSDQKVHLVSAANKIGKFCWPAVLGRNGIILSPEKFQFSSHEIDFAGFRVTDHEVKPLPKYLDAIRGFPRPTNISDVRSL